MPSKLLSTPSAKMTSTVPPQPPPALIAAEDVIPIMRRILQDERNVQDALVRDIPLEAACFANTIRPLIEIENRNCGKRNAIDVLHFASPDKGAREASEEANRLSSEARAESLKRRDLYLLVKAVKEKAEELDLESQEYIDERLRAYRRFGHGTLDDHQMARFLDSKVALDGLCQTFRRNLMDDDGGLWLTDDDLDGVPKLDRMRFRRCLEPDSMKCFVHFRRADTNIILKFANNPATRRRVYVAKNKRLRENARIFQEVILRRNESSWMLGYMSYAAFQLEERMAKTPEWVYSLMESLQTALLPQGRKEMDLLLDRKREHLRNTKNIDEYPDIMPPWDFPYYTRLAQEALNVDVRRISEYFPLQTTISGALRILERCLQLRFEKLTPEQMAASSWHEDVLGWSVWDERVESEPFVGYLYADLLFRPNKFSSSQDCNLQNSYLREDGSRVYPTTVLMCSFPRPTATGCALLKHDEVVSLFHELGHGMHDILSRTKYACFHGWQAPPDFAEGPSVMLENWSWMKKDLKEMSCHYTTLDPKYLEKWREENPGQPRPSRQIPDDLLDDLIKSREHNRALWFLGQLGTARFDMMVHDIRSAEELKSLDLAETWYKLEEELSFQQIPDPNDRGHPYAHFGHLLSGYDAGYYSYLSAHVVAANMFEAAFADGPHNQATWDRYRRGILQPGGSRNVLAILEEFIGHPLSTDVFLRSLRLEPASACNGVGGCKESPG